MTTFTLTKEDVQDMIREECQALQDLLIEKNESYGNAALDPLRIFSKASASEQIRVRLDDKLSRLARGNEYGDEDTEKDLIGYLILLRIARRATWAEGPLLKEKRIEKTVENMHVAWSKLPDEEHLAGNWFALESTE